MGWKEYYERFKSPSFGAHADVYERAINRLAECHSVIVDPQRPLNFVLGGFHPLHGTPEGFKELCVKIHPHPDDQYFLMDMNKFPLDKLDLTSFPPKAWRVQCRLEALPFKEASIDFLFADGTFDFMSEEQIRKLARFSSQVLSPFGLVMAIVSETGLKFWDKLMGKLITHVSFYPHSSSDIEQLTQPDLKTVLQASCADGQFYLAVLARKESVFPEHQGFPFDYG